MNKYLLFTLTFVGLSLEKLSAQSAPPYFQYQAVARDGSGVLAGETIGIQATILKNSMNGVEVYKEAHNAVPTNEFGLFSLKIGGGNATIGTSLSAIDWGTDAYWLRIGFKPPGGNDFLLLNATQLLSVPYALYAETAGNANDSDPDPANELQTLTQNGLNVTLSHGGGTFSVADNDNDPINEIQIISKAGGTVSLSKNGGSFTDEVNDADASPTNELQTLSLTGTNLTISGGNTLSLAGIGSQWLNNPTGIHYTNGRVGIGTSSPDFKLDIRAADSDADEDVVNIRKNAASGGAPGRNFLVRMRPSVPEVLLTTDGTAGQPRLTLGPAGGISSFLTIQPNENSGINTNTPEAGLDILRSNGAPALRVTKSAGQEHIAIFRRDPAPGVQPAMVITRQGFVGIGTDAPSQELHVIGSICYTGSSTSCSDGRYKQDIQPIAGALEKLSRINGRYYHW
ncbi:MAG: tail fiber domain-containing protein, partial [Thermoanaerobaculia bacterium]|nr:tail fiber domain-containing protein [Thermoanaerobaculia bacterium]